MLRVPEQGFAYSADQHNVKLDVLCDWIEASLLFQEKELSVSDLVDALCEENIYKSQEMAHERIGDAWAELRRRLFSLGSGSPFEITTSRISRRLRGSIWKNVPAHSFCVLLSLLKWYRSWAKKFGSDYTEQGEIFEELTQESLRQQFQGWEFYMTGWSRKSPRRLPEIVKIVADKLGESVGDVERWISPGAKDAGLDILSYRPFPDGRVGIPIYLIQCGSGGDWEGKMRTLNFNFWKKVVIITSDPMRAFATPFAFLDNLFNHKCVLVNGMLLDRYRLLAPTQKKRSWLSKPLRERIIEWASPRVEVLPTR